MTEHHSQGVRPSGDSRWASLWRTEDWWAVWIGLGILALTCLAVLPGISTEHLDALREAGDALIAAEASVAASGDEPARQGLDRARARRDALRETLSVPNPLSAWIAKPGRWESNPIHALYISGERNTVTGILCVLGFSLLIFGGGSAVMGRRFVPFVPAFVIVFALATLAYILAGQETIRHYNLEYALWALLVGLIVSNTVGTPALIQPAIQTEFYIKTGLVLLGAEILLSRLLTLGLPGICVAWIVTPIVLISTFWFGQRVLRLESRTLNMTLSADMSVCGVSAAIATAAACRAKKEELSLAIGISLSFTVVMMVVMPMLIRATGMSAVLGGAWIGGTIDATGAVAAAGTFLGDEAFQVAATVKMIQNILIGVIAFGVAMYWVTRIERDADGPRPSAWEIWHRFPKFVIGFLVASVCFSLVYGHYSQSGAGNRIVIEGLIQGTTKPLRGWFFCLAFVSIGLATDFRVLARHLRGGKPIILYVCGQSLNLILTLVVAWLMFVKLFPRAAG